MLGAGFGEPTRRIEHLGEKAAVGWRLPGSFLSGYRIPCPGRTTLRTFLNYAGTVAGAIEVPMLDLVVRPSGDPRCHLIPSEPHPAHARTEGLYGACVDIDSLSRCHEQRSPLVLENWQMGASQED
jgi:hypothetical protein